MALYMARIEVLVEVDDSQGWGGACDAISEGLRPLLKTYADEPENTNWIDWRYADLTGYPATHDGSGFELAEEKSDA